MGNPTEYLIDWFERFLKNRDLVFRKISEIKIDGDTILIKTKDNKTICHKIIPFIEDLSIIPQQIKADSKGIVVYNTNHNFDRLIKAWEELEQEERLTIYFINPFSKTEKKWAVNPRTHSLVSDKESFEGGLKTLFECVEPTTEREIEKITK